MRWIINMLQYGNKIFSRGWWIRWEVKTFRITVMRFSALLFKVYQCQKYRVLGEISWQGSHFASSCLSVTVSQSVFLTFLPEQFYILSSWNGLKWAMRGRAVFGIEKAVLEQSVLKYCKNHSRFWSIKWKSKKFPRNTGKAVDLGCALKLAELGGESLCWFQWALNSPCKGKRWLQEKKEVSKLCSHKLIIASLALCVVGSCSSIRVWERGRCKTKGWESTDVF